MYARNFETIERLSSLPNTASTSGISATPLRSRSTRQPVTTAFPVFENFAAWRI